VEVDALHLDTELWRKRHEFHRHHLASEPSFTEGDRRWYPMMIF
jgi:hypothetical protein